MRGLWGPNYLERLAMGIGGVIAWLPGALLKQTCILVFVLAPQPVRITHGDFEKLPFLAWHLGVLCSI